MAKRRKKSKTVKTNLMFELYGILILIFSVIALAREGHVGRSFHYVCRFFIGTWDFLIPLICIYIALHVMVKRSWPSRWTTRKTGVLLIVTGLLVMNHINLFQALFPKGDYQATTVLSVTWEALKQGLQPANGKILLNDVGGGMIGAIIYSVLYFLFDDMGARLVQFALFAIGLILVTNLSYVEAVQKLRARGNRFFTLLEKKFQSMQRGKAKSSPAAKTKGKAAVSASKSERTYKEPDFPYDDEFDEEVYRPDPKRKKPRFLQLLKQPGRQQDDDFDEDDLAVSDAGSVHPEEKVVYKVDSPLNPASLDMNDDPQADREFSTVFRDFQEQVQKEEKIVPSAPVPGGVTGPAAAVGSKASTSANAEQIPADEPLEALEDLQLGDAAVPPILPPYDLPSLTLLSKPAAGKGSEMADYKANARKLEATLESFGVRAKVLEVVRGPAVTRYEIQPDVGVKVSRIVSLTDDIALALAAKDIRMEAPIPGKSAIGIEVPNSEVSVVTMREVMETSAFQEASSRLSVTLGRDISGQPIVGNLAKMPHLLVAGATGSGKSVCINGIITSILYKAKPNEVKFLMVDPKMVELNVYNGIPHLMAPVVTDPRRASLALKKVVVEMEKRYELFSKSGTRNIEGYNAMLIENGTEAPLPYIVVIVDELADLMMVAANDVEDAICRLAQMARAAGIHLIIATQRPSVDVITGVIKANIPSRIAFGVSSQVDSRTILDMVGAEKLLGRGDMLYLPVGASKPVRVQGAFLSDQEVETVVNFVRTQQEANYREDMVPQVEEQPEQQDEFGDELYDQAVQIVIEAKQASASLLQRRMRIGYARAGRLIDSMESNGIVGPHEGSKPREVLISMEQFQHNRMSS
ncbi:DNA translocase FtsK [Paenibacillus sp. UNC499MF]|uniref:FtsK/SpoIIIE family DNA translocase n=1 Tax=Paenibacillus sp. UNC499MF TaxID=1502751 RepID=UPI00089FDF39|nr:DNA translocase FtsK [Paenibacillus sp. UNC499MF]SEF59881.1 DNA segregation ATPase FtsK/SpoIIIE, S-DNA-T family [Paenibacillus sp. UNC499MF]